MQPQVDKAHYAFEAYDTKERFCSYWTQIQAILELSRPPILEVGVGNKLVNDYIKRTKLEIKSMDIASDLAPDVVASVDRIPFEDSSFGTVMACQVLEHLPFDMFPKALSELFRVTRHYAIISLPNASRAYPVSVALPGGRKKQWLVNSSKIFPRGAMRAHEEHFWEIGWRGYPLERVALAMRQAGFKLLKNYRVFEYPYHHFFILDKAW